LENSLNLKNAVIDERIADARVKETRGIGLPQIDGSIAVQHNQKLPRFFAQYNPDQPGFIDLSGVPGIQSGDVVAMQNFFQLKSAGNASINVNQIFFNSSYLVGLKAASTYRELSVKTTEQTKEQVIEQVTKAYYGVLINKDRMSLFDNNIARVDSLLSNTKALNENGFAEAIDVDRIQVSLNNLKAERDKFYNLQELSLQLLKFQMNYPMKDNLSVAGDIASLSIDENVLSQYSANWDYTERTDYSILQTNKELLNLDLKNKYSTSLPSLVGFANLGYQTQSPTVGGVFKTESNIEDNGSIGPDKWYPAISFGVSLSVPIFSGLQRTYKVQQAKLALQKINNSSNTLKAAIDLEVKQSAINYLNAVTSLKSQQANRNLAENVARVTKIKYEQGVGSNLEVVDAESSLRESQINYYSALYDALVAKVDLDKAYGRLNPQTSEKK
jgi:outer membrane protein TolC